MKVRKKMILLIIGMVLIVVAIGGAIWWYAMMFKGCNPPLPRETMQVGSSTFDVEMATTMVQQACGLSGRTGLENGKGMLFVFSSGATQNFWMKDMNFSLDMVWIAGNKVVGFAQDVPPPAAGTPLWKLAIYTSPPNVNLVLELPAGTVAKDNVQIGQAVQVGM